jgi:ribosomal 50S subunit-associated protein YjgA (DUF615 family)
MSHKITVEQIIKAHPECDCPEFRELCATIERENTPPLALAFRLFTLTNALRDAQKIERHRIMQIVDACLEDDWRSALSLALTTELSAADAIEILKASGGGKVHAN